MPPHRPVRSDQTPIAPPLHRGFAHLQGVGYLFGGKALFHRSTKSFLSVEIIQSERFQEYRPIGKSDSRFQPKNANLPGNLFTEFRLDFLAPAAFRPYKGSI